MSDREELEALKRNCTLHHAHLDQWWREMEKYRPALETLLESMPKQGSVLRSILMLAVLHMATNALDRELDEIEERI